MRLVQTIADWNTTLWELLEVAERGVQLSRVFHIREGMTAADETLPDWLFDEPFKDRPLAGVAMGREAFGQALQLYYQMVGWDSEGCPLPARLHELDLGWEVEYLPGSQVRGFNSAKPVWVTVLASDVVSCALSTLTLVLSSAISLT